MIDKTVHSEILRLEGQRFLLLFKPVHNLYTHSDCCLLASRKFLVLFLFGQLTCNYRSFSVKLQSSFLSRSVVSPYIVVFVRDAFKRFHPLSCFVFHLQLLSLLLWLFSTRWHVPPAVQQYDSSWAGQVLSLILTLCAGLYGTRQAAGAHIPQSPFSIIWYQRRLRGKQAHHAAYWPMHVHGPAALAGVWLKAEESDTCGCGKCCCFPY